MVEEEETPLALVVGGDAATRAMVNFLLKEQGCDVVEMAAAENLPIPPNPAVALLVLIAAGLEEQTNDVINTLTNLRRQGYQQTALLLAHGSTQSLRRRAFALGARDIVTLPVSAHELFRRLHLALGDQPRRRDHRGDTIRAGGLTLRASTSHLSDGAAWSVHLTRRETALMKALMLTPGRVVEHKKLLDTIWGHGGGGDSNALTVLVRRLRAKVARPGVTPSYIHTIHGCGYAFDARATPRPSPDIDAAPGPRVLVVDDDAATVSLIADVLQQAGYSVTSGSGEEAPIIARRDRPHVILLDINMPGVDGVEVRRRLRTHPRTAVIPVIAFSAGYNLRAHMAEIGADDYLSKPFGVDELLLRIAKWARSAPTTPHLAPPTHATPHGENGDTRGLA